MIGCAVVSLIALILIPNRARVDHNVEYDEDAAMRAAGQANVPI